MEASRTQQQPETLTEEAALAALVVILLADLPSARVAEAVAALLAPLGIGAQAVEAAVSFIHPHVPRVFEADPLSASGYMARTQPARQAAFVLRAARRLTEGGTELDERRYLRQHLNAERAKREAAAKVDAAARRYGPLLGWRSQRDNRVTRECRNADGMNFSALRPPLIGYPGTLHGGACRCVATRPFPGGEMLP